jgi:hypothetical protein
VFISDIQRNSIILCIHIHIYYRESERHFRERERGAARKDEKETEKETKREKVSLEISDSL